MATMEPERSGPAPSLTSLPRIEDLETAPGGGYDETRVREAFEAFRRHALQLQAQLRVLQAAAGTSKVEPTAHAVRMDALHLIRAAAEFADQIERDAQNASAVQLSRAEEEIRRKHHELGAREGELERFRQESERQRADLVNTARAEAREVLANAEREANQEIREAESRAARLLEQSRHQATELTNAARAEVEQTLEWARAQASVIIGRAQTGAEQLLAAAGLGPEPMGRVIETILAASGGERSGGGGAPSAPPRSTEPAGAPMRAPSQPPAARIAQPPPRPDAAASLQSPPPEQAAEPPVQPTEPPAQSTESPSQGEQPQEPS